MPALPEGWELDYDGSRWIYRFTASGLIQYQFPKPGDEFPEYVGVGAFFDMTPEDCLASDKQVKRQSMEVVGTDQTKPAAAQRRKFLEDIKEVEAAEYLDAEKFMYLGPGSFFGSNPFGDQQARTKLEAKHSDTMCQQTPSSIKQRGEEAKAAHALKGARPREGNATTAPSIQTKLRMQSPVGFVAELASHGTRKQENHMSNVKPDVSDRPTAGVVDVHFNRLFELPAHESPINTKQPRPQQARVASAPLVDNYPLVSASFAFPPLPPKHAIDPPKMACFSEISMLPQKPHSREMARPLSCHEAAMPGANDPDDKPNRSEAQFASMPGNPTLTRLTGVKPQEPKRHSVHGPGPAAVLPRYPILPMLSPRLDIDSPGFVGLQSHQTTIKAPLLPPKIPLSPAGINADSLINDTTGTPTSEARREGTSSDTSRACTSSLGSSGLAHCPSVLRPGYRRSGTTSPLQQSQRLSVIAAPDRQKPHNQHLPHNLPIHQHLPHDLPIHHSHRAHKPANLQAQIKPQLHDGHLFEEPAVRMPDERDFAVRPTATARAASEPAKVSSPMTVSSPKSPSNGPGLIVFQEIGQIAPKRKSEPDPITSRTRETWAKSPHELGSDRLLPIELPSDKGMETKLSQSLPFVAPLRLPLSASRGQGELPPSVASVTPELAATPPVQREYSWPSPNMGNSAQTRSNTRSPMPGRWAGADGSRQYELEAVDAIPPEPASRPVLSKSIDEASGTSLPGLQGPSPLTRPASLAQSEVSNPSVSHTSLHHVTTSTPTPGSQLCEAPSTRPSGSETVRRSTNKQPQTRGQQAADIPPALGNARGNSAWSTSSIDYSGDEWGQNWYEECAGIVPEEYLPS